MQNALQASATKKHFKPGLHTDTPCANSQFIFNINIFDLKKLIIIFCMKFNYQVLILSRNRKSCFSESAVADFVLHFTEFTLIFESCIFYK